MNANSHDWYTGDQAFAWRLGFYVTVTDVLPDHRIAVIGVGGESHTVYAASLERI